MVAPLMGPAIASRPQLLHMVDSIAEHGTNGGRAQRNANYLYPATGQRQRLAALPSEQGGDDVAGLIWLQLAGGISHR
jgi:hypothetical protein